MKTYRIRVDGRVYEMDISLSGEEVYAETKSSVVLGERLPYLLKTEEEQKAEDSKEAR